MIKLLAKPKAYYWASIMVSCGVVYNLVQQDFIGVGILLMLSASLIAIGFMQSRKSN